MIDYARDVSVNVLAALLVATIMTAAAMEDVPPERAERHLLAAALGDHAELAMADGAVDAPPEQVRRRARPPVPTDHAELERIAIREYERAGMSRHAPWLLAQIQAESRFDCDAVSPVGAQGCAQAMPPTWADEAPRTDPSCAGVPPSDPECGFRFQVSYGKRVARWVDDPGNLHLATAAYNAGAGWIRKEIAACERAMGCDPTRWFGNVEKHCVRAAWACRQTREYLAHIAEFSRTYRDNR